MTDQIRAPWTPAQVVALNRFQAEGGMHPFTCGNEHPARLNTVLWATTAGWRCNVIGCDYEQDWAHAFMADPSRWPKPFAELRAAALPACIHPEGYDGECPCPPNCPCCTVTAAAPDPDELTAEEARALVAELGLDLYRAQDALEYVEEWCVIADRERLPITTADVREWLKGPRCGRQLAADRQAATDATDWHDAGCARDCSEQHTYEWGRCAMAPKSARPIPTIGILWVEGGDGLAKDIVSRSIPLTAWEELITVAKWVSRGRSFALDADPDIAPRYPDAEARHALGALDDAGLLDRPGDDHAYARMVNRPLTPRETAAFRARLESGDYPRRKVRPRTAPEASEPPSLDGGPDVADCAAADRNWDVERAGE